MLGRGRLLMSVQENQPTRVLLIVGMGRSGSTMIERALAGVPGVVGLGEVVHLWERGVRDNELCACGAPFHDCDFWSQVGRRAFGGWAALDVDRVIAQRAEVIRTRYVSRLLAGRGSPSWHTTLQELTDTHLKVLGAAKDVAGARLVVDSSKLPAYAAMLATGKVDLRMVEVVRDPRGVAYSLRKTVRRPEASDDADVMHRTGLVASSAWWSAFELLGRMLNRSGQDLMTTIRYEDFVSDPAETLAQICQFVQMSGADLSHLEGDRLLLQPNHQIAGNPVRFDSGVATIRADEEWRAGLSTREQRTVKVLTTGLRRRHGYR
ncbi:MAG: sulfotransferase [Nocardioides sp.]